MYRIFNVKVSTLLIFILVLTPLLGLSIWAGVDVMFTCVLIVWTGMFIVSISDLQNHSAMFCFLISFFVFLLGRQFCYSFFELDRIYAYLDGENTYTYVCLLVSLIGICVGCLFSGEKVRVGRGHSKKSSFLESERYGNNYKFACKIAFYVCYMFTLLNVALRIAFVRRVGYLASYTDSAGGAGIPTIVIWISSFTPVCLSLYLAAKPKKKDVLIPAVLYELYAVLTVLTGQRYPFIGISMYFLIYWLIRNKEEGGWIKPYHYFLLVAAIPVLMILITAYDAIRLGQPFEFNNFFEAIQDFFVQQGGSVNVIRRTIHNADELSDLKFVSFESTRSAVFENAITRRLFDIQTYSGNSIEHAMNGHSFTHRISYIAYGPAYLWGQGTGSSYIAELLHDFGLSGVLIGSVFYGVILKKISNIKFTDKLKDGIRFSMVYYLLLAPRGTFDSFIGNVFTLQTMLGFICIIVFSKLLKGMRHTDTI